MLWKKTKTHTGRAVRRRTFQYSLIFSKYLYYVSTPTIDNSNLEAVIVAVVNKQKYKA